MTGENKNVYAGIDIGSNTIRLIIADLTGSTLHAIRRELNITRLGKGFHNTCRISDEPYQKSLAALKEYKRIIDESYASVAAVVATGVLRLAENAKDFLTDIKKETGLEVRIISGSEEARLTALGVKSAVPSGKSVILDVGGGSTELICTNNDSVDLAHSIDIGAVTLYESFVKGDPPAPYELEAMSRGINESLKHLKESIISMAVPYVFDSDTPLIFTAGTATTLAAIKLKMDLYDPDRVNGLSMTRAEVQAIYDELTSRNKEERKRITGLEMGREDIIISGTSVALSVMELFGKDDLTVSDSGLLEGIVIDSARPLVAVFRE